jgi:hypothetical protein
VLTGSEVGEEVIRTLVGGLALVLAVPVTTLIGALVATAATATTAEPAPELTEEEREAERRRERLRAIREGQPAVARAEPPRPRDPR